MQSPITLNGSGIVAQKGYDSLYNDPGSIGVPYPYIEFEGGYRVSLDSEPKFWELIRPGTIVGYNAYGLYLDFPDEDPLNFLNGEPRAFEVWLIQP